MYLRPGAQPDKPIMATREVVSGFDCTAETPFKSVWITAYPLFENLPHAVATVVLVFSKRDCVVFYSFQTVKEIDWGKLAPIESQKWTYFTVLMKSELDASSASLKLIKSFEVFLTKEVKQRLGLVDEEAAPVKATKKNEEERGGSKPSADSQRKTARNQPESK
jgi:hypothetical protein